MYVDAASLSPAANTLLQLFPKFRIIFLIDTVRGGNVEEKMRRGKKGSAQHWVWTWQDYTLLGNCIHMAISKDEDELTSQEPTITSAATRSTAALTVKIKFIMSKMQPQN